MSKNEAETKVETEAEAKPAGESATSESGPLTPEQVESLKGRAAKADEHWERLLRTTADFDNFKKRAAREKGEAVQYANVALLQKLLPVLDNFELALKSTGTAEQLRSGVELIVKQMEEVLKGLNVLPVETVGVQFDPHVHEALGSVEREDLPDHAVAEEIRRGYKMRDRLLRPAMVRVASNTKQQQD